MAAPGSAFRKSRTTPPIVTSSLWQGRSTATRSSPRSSRPSRRALIWIRARPDSVRSMTSPAGNGARPALPLLGTTQGSMRKALPLGRLFFATARCPRPMSVPTYRCALAWSDVQWLFTVPVYLQKNGPDRGRLSLFPTIWTAHRKSCGQCVSCAPRESVAPGTGATADAPLASGSGNERGPSPPVVPAERRAGRPMGVDSGEVTSAEAVGSVEGEDLPFGLALTDLGDHFLDVNRAICEIVGRSRADLLGGPYVTIVHPEDWSREKDRRAEVLSGRASTYTVDERYVRADGAVRWVTVRASMVGRGRPVLIRRVLDISERIQAEVERDRLFALSPDVIAAIDSDGTLLRMNPAMTRVLGWNPEDLRSLNLVDLLHPDDRDAAVAEFRKVLLSEEVVDVQA